MEVSVIVLTYNSSWEKTKSTIKSVINQKNIDVELVISDDASQIDNFDKIANFLKECNFTNYKLIKNNQNLGIVKNLYNAIKTSAGEYFYYFGPGDMVYNSTTLCNFYKYCKENNAKICFGNSVHYSNENGLEISNKDHSCKYEYFWENNTSLRIQRMNFHYHKDYILGAGIMREKEIALRYIGKLIGLCKYIEDNTSIPFMLADAIRVYHYNQYVIWYERGSGISTSGKSKWQEFIRKDLEAAYELLKKEYPNDKIIKASDYYSKNKKQYLKLLFKYPHILFFKEKYRFKKRRRVISLKDLEVNTLKEYLGIK